MTHVHGSTTVGWLLVALCAVTGLACALRARGARGRLRAAAASEALMGFAMAAMALPSADGPAVPPGWLLPLFCLAAGGELALAGGGRRHLPSAAHHLHHLLGATAMAYLAWRMAGSAPSGAAAGGALADVLTGVPAAYFAAYVLGAGALLLSGRGVAGAAGTPYPPGPVARPRTPRIRELPDLPGACRVAMGTGMLAMLLTM